MSNTDLAIESGGFHACSGVVMDEISLYNFASRITADKDAEIARITEELNEEARLNGMGGEREADLLGKVERLNALVAMQSEALQLGQITSCSCMTKTNDIAYHSEHCLYRILGEALSATAETVSAWQSKRDNEIWAKALEDAQILTCDDCHGRGTTDNHITGEVECSSCEGLGMVVELRAKGE